MTKKKIIGGLITLLVLSGVIGGGYWYSQQPKTIVQENGESIEISAQDYKDLKQLKKVYDLPEDVVPLMAVVTDADALREQQPVFFAKAKNGDRIAVFRDVAILFEPKEPKLRHVGPVNFGDSPGQQASVPFAILNGSTSEIADKAFSQTLLATFNNAKVISAGNAVGFYEKNLVIDLTQDGNPEIEIIAESLGAEISELPEGEAIPEGAAVLVIIGQDYADALNKPQE